MISLPVIPSRRHSLWLAAVLLCGAACARADEPLPRVLNASEWDGVMAAHDDPWPAVREAAEAMMRKGVGGEYGVGYRAPRIGGYFTPPSGNVYVNVQVTLSDPAALPAWAKYTPDYETDVVLPPAGTIEGKWARAKLRLDWDDIRTRAGRPMSPSVHAPLAAALLENDDPQLVEEGLRALEDMKAAAFAPQIAAVAFHRDEDIASRAVELLGSLGAREYADMLATLAETRVALRFVVMETLFIFDDRRAVPLAVELLGTPKLGVRLAGMNVLAGFKDKRAADFAAQVLLDVPSGYVDYSKEATEVLRQYGTPELGRTFAAVLTAGDETAWPAALDGLAAVHAVQEAPAVAALMSTKHPYELRLRAIKTLAELGAVRYADQIAAQLEVEDLLWESLNALGKLRAVQHEKEVRAVLRRAALSPNSKLGENLQAHCIRTLYQMGVMPRKEVVMFLIKLLEVTDSAGMSVGLDVLVELDAVEAVETILRLEGDSPRSENAHLYRLAPITALTKLGFHQRCSEIAPFLESPVEAVKMGALAALVSFGASEYVHEIAALLDSREPFDLRMRALDALNYLKRKEAAEAIAALLIPEESTSVRFRALQVLGILHAPGTEKRIARQTTGQYPEHERLEAWNVLWKFSDLSQVEACTRALLAEAESQSVRVSVLKELSREGRREAAPVVAEMLSGKNEAVLETALSTLLELGGDARVDQLLPLLRHTNSWIREQAARLLCRLGPGGRRSLLKAAEDESLREIALSALMENNEASVADLSGQQASSDTLVGWAVHWADRRSTGVTALLADSLLDQRAQVRAASLAALIVCGGDAENVWPCALEAALRYAGEEGPMLLAAYIFPGQNPDARAALPWLGGRDREQRPQIPTDAGAARETVRALQTVWHRHDPQRYPRLTYEAAKTAAEIIAAAAWKTADIPLLEEVAAEMRGMRDLKETSAAVLAVAERVNERDPLRRTVRWTLWTLGLQPFVWVLVLLVYPYSRLAQWMVWSRAVRRVAGLAWVGPVVLRVAWLRERMWRPFREELVPPGEVVTFDEWTFFDAVLMVPAEGGAARAALPVFAEMCGAAVLRGASGLGKTTLLQALAATAPRPAALLRATECSGGLLAALQSRLPPRARHDAGFLRALVLRGSPHLFVDAVHEARPEVQARLSEEVMALPDARVLLTAQPSAWKPPAGATVWELQPLRVQDIAPFLLQQGTAAVEAAGSGTLADRQRAFTRRATAFLADVESLPPGDARGTALLRMLGNPMEAVLAAELLAAGQTPDPARLLAQRMEHLEEDYTAQHGGTFPAQPFADHLLTWRRSGSPLLRLDVFEHAAAFLARHRLLRKNATDDGWRFRHDKILDWFLQAAAPAL